MSCVIKNTKIVMINGNKEMSNITENDMVLTDDGYKKIKIIEEDSLRPRGKGDLNTELHRTAELLVDIAEMQGVYFAIALLHDSNYDIERINKLLPILEKKRGAIKKY